MNHRHLTPEEIDLLADAQAGHAFVPAVTADPIGDCAHCRARLQDATALVNLLDGLPRLAPAHTFSDRVMVQVPVFVPWWVSLRDTVKPWIPASHPARIGLGVLATAAASVISVVFLWVMTQTDVLAMASGAAGNRMQDLFAQGVQALVATVFGEGALGLIQRTGPAGMALALTGIVAAGAIAILGLRGLAAASSRRRAAVADTRA